MQQGSEANKDRVFIPTGMHTFRFSISSAIHHKSGFQSKQLIVQAGLNLGDVDEYPTIDVTIDGADEYVL